jgi:PAS domain S-box-containing protein
MSSENAVLCLSTDADVAERLASPLRSSYPRISVAATTEPDDAISRIEAGDVDCVLADAETVESAPAVLAAVREQYPAVPLLLLSPSDVDGDSVLAEIVDFVELDEEGADAALGGWVANAVVHGSGPASHPASSPPEDTVDSIKRLLVDASSPMDIEHAVCDQLTHAGRYTFAWVGEYDPGERQVVPWVTSTAPEEWPTSRTFGAGARAPDTVLDDLLRTREAQLVDDIEAYPAAVPWRSAALQQGCVAAAFLPLVENGDLHGVLGVYTDSENGFSDVERSVLEEVAETTAHVLDSIAVRAEIGQQERVLKRYERLVETVGDGMYALDPEGHFMTVNNGLLEMTGYAREGLLGEHVSILLDEDDSARRRETVERLENDPDRDKEAVEITINCKDGTRVPCENQIALLPQDDSLRGTVGVLRDITERKKRERELERQNERLEAFARIVSHDLRNPLSVAQGYVDIVAKQVGDLDALDNVRDGLERMEDIIGDVLALARHGQTVTETQQLTLDEVVSDAWSNVRTQEARIEIESSGPIAADRSRLLRSFENLFRNSVEHGSTSPASQTQQDTEAQSASSPDSQVRQEAGNVTIRVGLLPDVDDVTTADSSRSTGFYVEDDGPGMPEKVRKKAFDSSFTTSEEGLGIGLWVVREVASAHGWTVDVTESETGGARFEFRDVRAHPE